MAMRRSVWQSSTYVACAVEHAPSPTKASVLTVPISALEKCVQSFLIDVLGCDPTPSERL